MDEWMMTRLTLPSSPSKMLVAPMYWRTKIATPPDEAISPLGFDGSVGGAAAQKLRRPRPLTKLGL